MVGMKSRRVLKSVALVIGIAAALFLVFFFVIVPLFLIEGHSPEYGMETTYETVTVEGPSREDFSSDEAWADYRENWQDPSWDGEYPEGWRYKIAHCTFLFGGSEHEEAWVAGLLDFRWNDGSEISEEDARTIAGLTGANGWLLVDDDASKGTVRSWHHLLLFYDEDLNLELLLEDRSWEDVAAAFPKEEVLPMNRQIVYVLPSRGVSVVFERYMEMTQGQ